MKNLKALTAKVKIAVIQPKSFKGERERENVTSALTYLDSAIEKGAKIICFPELYPGPSNPSSNYDSTELNEKAKTNKVYIIKSRIEKEQGVAELPYSVCAELIGPDGEVIGKYKRTTPSGPYLYRDEGGLALGFDYQQFSDLPVFDTEYGKIGILICSEVYVPELSRILALKGAEIVFYPAGGLINELLPTWRTMVWARAIENIMYTGACQNLYGVEEGIGMIASPEGVLIEEKNEGVLVAEADMGRIRWLREQYEKIEMPKQYKVIPGTLRWRRPQMYRENYKAW